MYVLEVNARVTGMTPIYSTLPHVSSVPFILLHILELAGEHYTIDDASPINGHYSLKNSSKENGSLLMYHFLPEVQGKATLSLPLALTQVAPFLTLPVVSWVRDQRRKNDWLDGIWKGQEHMLRWRRLCGKLEVTHAHHAVKANHSC